jgi:hypothetical protein
MESGCIVELWSGGRQHPRCTWLRGSSVREGWEGGKI